MALWSVVVARLYDTALGAGERAGMHARRVALLATATGRVVEIGAGTGLNARLYPPGLDELVLTEPDPAMVRQLRRKAPAHARIEVAGAEELPFEDGSVDTVVSTLVLCTVPDPQRVLAEIVRVLRPGGRLLFIEHVRADDPAVARWQDRLETPWRWFGDGCHCNRSTLELIRAAGLEPEGVSHEEWSRMPRIVRPLVVGRASMVLARWR